MRTTLYLALASLTTACAVDTSSTTTSAVNVNTKGEVISKADIKTIQAATRQFKNVENALAADYIEFSPECFAEEENGELETIGVFYDTTIYADEVLEAEHPESLIYEPQADGSLELVGVEYWVPLTPDDTADSPAPTIFGIPLNFEPEMGVWGLHVWAWRENPEGITHESNPNVSCP